MKFPIIKPFVLHCLQKGEKTGRTKEGIREAVCARPYQQAHLETMDGSRLTLCHTQVTIIAIVTGRTGRTTSQKLRWSNTVRLMPECSA